MATDSSVSRRAPIRARPRSPLRRSRQEEMGHQQRLHGLLRLRRRFSLLGALGL